MSNTAAILKPNGYMVLHFIGNNGTALKGREDPWLDKYVASHARVGIVRWPF